MARVLKKKSKSSKKPNRLSLASPLVLGSASPRRQELLAPYFDLIIRPANIDESEKKNEPAMSYVKRIAREKWHAVRKISSDRECVLTADTTVILGSKIFGKPSDEKDARRMLSALSNKTHLVATAVCLGFEKPVLKVVTTKIKFRKLSGKDLDRYIQSMEWKDKAGAYAIQGLAQSFVASINGSLTNVIGLPLEYVLEKINRSSSNGS